jgi:hypothetical protein
MLLKGFAPDIWTINVIFWGGIVSLICTLKKNLEVVKEIWCDIGLQCSVSGVTNFNVDLFALKLLLIFFGLNFHVSLCEYSISMQ